MHADDAGEEEAHVYTSIHKVAVSHAVEFLDVSLKSMSCLILIGYFIRMLEKATNRTIIH